MTITYMGIRWMAISWELRMDVQTNESIYKRMNQSMVGWMDDYCTDCTDCTDWVHINNNQPSCVMPIHDNRMNIHPLIDSFIHSFIRHETPLDMHILLIIIQNTTRNSRSLQPLMDYYLSYVSYTSHSIFHYMKCTQMNIYHLSLTH